MAKVLMVHGFRILIMHGHTLIGPFTKPEYIAKFASEHGFNVFIFGHTHEYLDETIDGVRLLNPGATSGSASHVPTYMIVEISGNELKATKKEYNPTDITKE